jgi:zinc and cadmium transporter
MTTFSWIFISTTIIALFAWVGIFTLALKEKLLEKILLFLVSLSTGVLMGGAFLHLLPEAAEKFESANIFLYVLIAFVTFFLIEKLLHWRHCHKGHCQVHTFGYMNLFGDSVHNFIDGLIIAASFAVSEKLGLVTVLAVALHEIPQEIGDFGVLVYAGFRKELALVLNFFIALTIVLGGIFGYYLSVYIESSIKFLLPFAAGGFIYIAASDLIPEIRKETGLLKSLVSFGIFLAGIVLMYLLRFFEG